MAKRYITQLLSESLGTYLDGLDSTQIQFNMSEAILQMENVIVKEDCLTKLKLPIKIKHGMIRKLDVRVPWRTITSSPVQITLEGINLLLTPQERNQWEFSDIFAPENLAANLDSIIQSALLEQTTQAQQSYFDGFRLKILDNIKINISDVHFRVEHFIAQEKQEVKQSSFGILIKSFNICTVDKDGKEIFHDRTTTKTNIFKKIALEGLAIYLNPFDQTMIHKLPKVMLTNYATISSHMKSTIKSYVQLMELNQEEQSRFVDDPNLIYILKPLSLRITVQRKTEKPEKISIEITLDQFNLQFLYNQLKAMLVFARLAQQYRSRASEQDKVKKYRFLRNPTMNVSQKWKFAINCILRSIRTKKGALTAFNIPEKKIKEFEEQFIPFLKQYNQFPFEQRNNLIQQKWSKNEQMNFWHTLSVLSQTQIKQWVKQIVLLKEKQNKDQQNDNGGWMGWMFGMNSSQKQKNQDQEDNLEQFFDCDDGTQNEIGTRERTSLEVTYEVKELTLLFGKINPRKKLEGIQMYNKGASIFLKSPTLLLDEFIFEVTFQESGVNLVTIDTVSGFYQDCRSAILQNKKSSQLGETEKRPQLTLEIRKGDKDLRLQGVEYDINLQIGSIIYKHYEDLIIRAKAFSNVQIDDNIQTVAVGALEDLRETTQNRLHELIYKGKNRYLISIESPVIILPIFGTFEGKNTSIWVINTGNMLILSEDLQKKGAFQQKLVVAKLLTKQKSNQSQSVNNFEIQDEYDGYRVNITQIGLHYYQSFEVYQNSSRFSQKSQTAVYAGKQLPLMPARLHEFTQKQNEHFNIQDSSQTMQEFSVLEDFEVRILLKTLKTSTTKNTIAAVLKVEIQTSPIQINFSSGIYNQLVNFSNIFYISKEKQKEFTQEFHSYQLLIKEELQQNTIIEGNVARVNSITGVLEQNFAILSGKYLYFYENKNSPVYLDVIEIVNAEVKIQGKKIQISQKGQQNGLKTIFIPDDPIIKWESQIRLQIFNLLHEQPDSITQMVERRKTEIKRTAQNPEQISLSVDVSVPSLKLQLLRMKIMPGTKIIHQPPIFENWVTIAFLEMKMTQNNRLYDSEQKIQFQQITLSDCTMPMIHQTLISQSQNEADQEIDTQSKQKLPSLEIEISNLQKESSKYVDLLSEIKVTLININFKFMPGTINQVLKLLRTTKLQTNPQTFQRETVEHEQKIYLEEDISDNLNQQQTPVIDFENTFDQKISNSNQLIESQDKKVLPQQKYYETTCQVNKAQISRISCNVKNIKMSMLHHKYTMELYCLDASSLQIQMNDWYDHSSFNCKMTDLRLSDLTNYPYTYNPRIFYETVQKGLSPEKITPNELIRCDLFEFNLLSFSSDKCVLKLPQYNNKLTMKISPFRINYVQEVTMRFIEYFQQRFIDSLTMTDPYQNPKEEFEMRQKRKGVPINEINHKTDFQQPKMVDYMDIEICKAEIYARDRPHSKNYIKISSPTIKISSELVKVTGCFPQQKSDIVLGMQRYKIELKSINFLYIISKKKNGKIKLLKETFNIKINYDALLYSELLEKVDIRQMDKSTNVNIEIDPVLLLLPQAVYTYILRCNDLNFGWSDRLQAEFYCIKWIHMQDYYKNLKNIVSQRINIVIPLLSLTLKHTNGNFMSELDLCNFNLKMNLFMDGASTQNIICSQFFILDQETSNKQSKKQAIVCPWDSPLLVEPSELITGISKPKISSSVKEEQFKVLLKMSSTGEKNILINITGLKIFLKMPLFIMLQGFFLNAFPQYQSSDIDKPLWFEGNDPDNTGKMILKVQIHKSLICLLNQPGFKSIACQGEIQFETNQENINEVKKLYNRGDNYQREHSISQVTNQEHQDDHVYSMKIKINQFTPYICSLSHLETGAVDFSQINKRQLLSPLDLEMEQSYQLTNETDVDFQETGKWGVVSKTNIKIGKLQLRLSILDLHLILQVAAFASEQMAQETVNRLQEIEKNIDQDLINGQDNEGNLQQNNLNQSNTLMKSHNKNSQYPSANSVQSEKKKKEFFDNLIHKFQESNTDSMATVVERLSQTTNQFKKLTQGYTGRSYNERESFLQFITIDMLENDNLPEILDEMPYKKPFSQSNHNNARNLNQEKSSDSSEEEEHSAQSEEFHDAIEDSNSYQNLVLSERQKQLQYAFKSIQQASQNSKQSLNNQVESNGEFNGKQQSLKSSQRQKSSFEENNLNQRKNSANHHKSQKSLQSSQKSKEIEDDEFVSARGSFESYREAVESAVETFYSFHEKRNIQTTKTQQYDEIKPWVIDEADQLNFETVMKAREQGVIPIRETLADLRQSQSFHEESEDSKSDVSIQKVQVAEDRDKTEVQQSSMSNIIEDLKDMYFEQISLLAINDYNSGFTPVLQLECSKILMNQSWKKNNQTYMCIVAPEILINYYNIELGEWEPLLEQTQMIFEQQSTQIDSITNLKFEKPINLNSTQECLKNLFYTYESWMQTPQFFQKPKKGKSKDKLSKKNRKFTYRDSVINESESNDENDQYYNGGRSKIKNKKFINQMRESIINFQQTSIDQSKRYSTNALMQTSQISEEPDEFGSDMERISGDLIKNSKGQKINNQQLVTPFSIANYTPRTIKIVRGGIKKGQFFLIRRHHSSEVNQVKTENQQIYILNPSMQTDYAVTYDRLMGIQKISQTNNDDSDQIEISGLSKNNSFDKEKDQNDDELTPDLNNTELEDQVQRKKLQKIKNNEMIGIQLSDLDYVPYVDLNRNTGENPWVHEITKITPHQTQRENQKNSNQMDNQIPLLESQKQEMNQSFDSSSDQLIKNKVFYGTILKGMRRFLIVRAPYCIVNKTSYSYEVRIMHSVLKDIKFRNKIPPGEQIGLDDSYYSNHTLQVRILKKDQDFNELRESESGWSERISISKIFELPLNNGTGVYISSTDNLVNTTCIKRQDGEINGTIDFVLLPAITIKNCLPSSLLVRQRFKAIGQGSLAVSSKGSHMDTHQVEQSQEKQFHVFSPVQVAKTGVEELQLEIGVAGFVFTALDLKILRIVENEEIEFEIADINDNTLKIGIRKSYTKAGFYLVFFAYVCILAETVLALPLMKIYYKGVNFQQRRPLANSEEMNQRKYIMCNKDSDIVVGIKDSVVADRQTYSYSTALDLKEAGKQTSFHVMTAPKQNGNQMRFDFICTPNLYLSNYEDGIYSKVVQLTPKYVICNMTKTCLEITQVDNIQSMNEFNRIWEANEKKEWYWPVGNINEENLKITFRKIKPQNVKKLNQIQESKLLISGQGDIEESKEIDNESNKQRRFSESDRILDWNWSKPISLQNQISFPILLTEKDGSRKKIFLLSKKFVSATTFIIIREEEVSVRPTFQIKNNCPNMRLQFQQDGQAISSSWKLGELEETSYAHIDPQARLTTITFNLTIDKGVRSWKFKNTHCFERQLAFINMDQDFTEEIEYSDLANNDKKITVHLQNDGLTKTLEFKLEGSALKNQKQKSNQPEIAKKQIENKLKRTTMNVVLHSLSISIIGYTLLSVTKSNETFMKKERNEIALLTISSLNFSNTTNLETNEQQTNIEIVKIQLDNQSSQNPLFQTILEKRDTSTTAPPFLLFIFKRQHNAETKITTIDFFQLQIADHVLRLDDSFLMNIYETISKASQLNQTIQSNIHPLFMKESLYDLSGLFNQHLLIQQMDNVEGHEEVNFRPSNLQSTFSKKKISNLRRKTIKQQPFGVMVVYEVVFNQKIEDMPVGFQHWMMLDKSLEDSEKLELKNFQVSKLVIDLTVIFRTKDKKNTEQNSIKFLQSSGLKLASIDELQLKFDQFGRNEKFMHKDDLITTLYDFYISNAWNQILKMAFSLKFIGQPANSYRHFAEGCFDMINMPREGFNIGATRGLIGVGLGTVNFFRKFLIAGFCFTQAIGESWSDMALILAFDKEYAIKHEEEVITERSKNFVEGLGYGAFSALQSVQFAVTGFFTRPVIEARRGGTKGFIYGTLQGVSGIFFKPLSGIFDLVAKTSEGCKNTLRILEQKQKKGRVRMPRTFYGIQRRIKSFNEDDAFIVSNVLCQIKRGEFSQDHYIDMKLIRTANDNRAPHFLLLSEENLFLIEASQKALVWHIEQKHILKIQNMNNGLLINLNENEDYAGRAQVGLPLDGQSSVEINEWFGQIMAEML